MKISIFIILLFSIVCACVRVLSSLTLSSSKCWCCVSLEEDLDFISAFLWSLHVLLHQLVLEVLVTTFFSLVTNFFSTFKDIPSHLHLGNGTFAAVVFLFFIIFHVQSSLLLLPLSLLLLLSL